MVQLHNLLREEAEVHLDLEVPEGRRQQLQARQAVGLDLLHELEGLLGSGVVGHFKVGPPDAVLYPAGEVVLGGQAVEQVQGVATAELTEQLGVSCPLFPPLAGSCVCPELRLLLLSPGVCTGGFSPNSACTPDRSPDRKSVV